MTNKILAFFLGLTTISHTSLCAERDENYKFHRWTESAQPTPDEWKTENFINEIPEFLNYNKFTQQSAAFIQNAEPGVHRFSNKNTIVETGDASPMQNESSIAVNPKNLNNLISSAVDYRGNGALFVSVSDDGGRTWRNVNLGKAVNQNVWTSSNDPSVVFDANGRGYVCYGIFNRSSRENGIGVSYTDDGGKTWTTHKRVILHTGTMTADSAFEDKYYISVDNNPASPHFKRLYIPWKRMIDRDSSTQIFLSYSDNGDTWSNPVAVSEKLPFSTEDTTFGQSFPLAATGPQGEVYVVWNYGPKRSIGFNVSTDGGRTFGTSRLIQTYKSLGTAINLAGEGTRHRVKGKVRAETYPTLAVDNSSGSKKGWLYLAWAADSIPQIYFSRSTDGGVTWSAPKTVHSDPKGDKFWPWLALDPLSGNIGIMYFDSRDDATNTLVNCYVSLSTDGGDTWIDRRVSDVSTDLRRNPFQNQSFAGDYSGCAFYDGIIYPSWFDSRNTASNIANSDVYTALVNTRAPEPASDFSAKTLPNEPTVIELAWKAPTKKVFGQSLSPSEFSYALFRNGTFISTLSSGSTSKRDTVPAAYEKYTYKLIAFVSRSANQADSSYDVEASAFAGGARKPDTPNVTQIFRQPSSGNIEITARIPSFREDKTTPFVNPSEATLYRDSVVADKKSITITDVGSFISFVNAVPERGWYKYSVSVSDNFTPKNESEASTDTLVFGGETLDQKALNIESLSKPKLVGSPEWNVHELPFGGFALRNNLSSSISINYRQNQRDTLLLPENTSQNGIIKLRHAVLVHPSDTAFVEGSSDLQSWEVLGKFNSSSAPQWADTNVTAASFTESEIPSRRYVRLRFRANVRDQARGWFVQRVEFRLGTSVLEQPTVNSIRVYPNPASEALSWENTPRSIQTIEIISSIGEVVFSTVNVSNQTSGSIPLQKFAPGTYVIVFRAANGNIFTEKLSVIR